MGQTSLNSLHYVDDVLNWGNRFDLSPYAAKAGEAPVFLYNLPGIQERYQQMRFAWNSISVNSKIFYAMKANSHREILKLLKGLGSGIDVVSAGEIRRALECGFTSKEIIFSGVGKSKSEIEFAVDQQIHQINVESLPELQRLAQITSRKKKPISIVLRINPNVDVKTHPYIATGLSENKFGLEISAWPEIREILKGNNFLSLTGISLHLGSQMMEFGGLSEAVRLAKDFYLEIKKEFSTVRRFDVGGGLGVIYERQDFSTEEKMLRDYVEVARNELRELLVDAEFELQSEPGRWLVAHSGILLTEIQYVKETPRKKFLIVNAGMNLLLRPALYQSYHQVLPMRRHKDRKTRCYDVVGPICESADFLAKDRDLFESYQDEILCVADVGAYGAVMSSDYNLQTEPQEICLY